MLHSVKLLLHLIMQLGGFWSNRRFFSHTKVFPVSIVDNPAGLLAVETSRRGDKLWNVERQETLTVETAWIALRQHESFGDVSEGIDVAEIGACEKSVVAA